MSERDYEVMDPYDAACLRADEAEERAERAESRMARLEQALREIAAMRAPLAGDAISDYARAALDENTVGGGQVGCG